MNEAVSRIGRPRSVTLKYGTQTQFFRAVRTGLLTLQLPPDGYYTGKRSVRVTVEELYQHFADRLRAELAP